MEKITLKLNVNEINTILTGLGSVPFHKVFELIQKIRAHAQEQLAVKNDQ